MNIAPNRAVAVLTPLVFAPLAGAISVLVAKYAPGVDISSGSLEAVFIAGATIAFAKAGLWLKGWQQHELHQDGVDAAAAPAGADDEPDLGPDPDDGEALDIDEDPDLDEDALLEPVGA
jgi:hypothetical protein